MGDKPVSRTEDVVIQEMNGEVLLYDKRAHKAFCLNETAARVWRACDGSSTVEQIVERVGNEDIVWLALNDLKERKLVEHDMNAPAKFEGMSRRAVIGKIGAGSLLAVPVIASLVAPTAAQSGSVCGRTCTNPGQCPGLNGTCNNCVSGICQ